MWRRISTKSHRAVLIYIEPTPYVVALVQTLRRLWQGPIEVRYVTKNLSQAWNLQLDREHETVLPVGFFATARAIRKVLNQGGQPTLLHLAGWGHSVLLGAMLMARSLGIPVAIESDTAEGRSGRARGMLKMLLYPMLFRLPSRFLPGGTRQARYLTRFGVRQDRIRIAQMTVDVSTIRRFCGTDREALRAVARAHWGVSVRDRAVLYVGRLEYDKGIQQLLSAFDHAAGQYDDLRLIIAGDGTLRSCVEAIAARPDSHVTYLGHLVGDDVWRAYLAADLLVLPSLFEPWGLVVNEAMACGLPVIVSDRVGCADDLVRHDETGIVVEAGSELALTSAILRLARDTSARVHMGHAAEQLISNWTLENEAHNIVSAWGEMIQ